MTIFIKKCAALV